MKKGCLYKHNEGLRMAQTSDRSLIHVTLSKHSKPKRYVLKVVTIGIAYIFNLPVVLEPIYDFYTALANI